MISDIPAGDGKMANLFLQCTLLDIYWPIYYFVAEKLISSYLLTVLVIAKYTSVCRTKVVKII